MSLSAHELLYRRDDRNIVDGVSLQVEPGQIHCIVGPNGAGKSTLLELLCGERKAERGDIRYNGQALGRLSLAERARSRAMLPQRDLLTFAFSVDEVVSLGRMASLRQGAGREAEILEQAQRATDVWTLRDQAYTHLSGGERARVQLARVLAQIWEPGPQPRILLLDEPTASLDLAHQHRCLQAIRSFADTGVAVVAILHDLNLAMSYADQVTLLSEGRVVASGTPTAVLTTPNLQAVYNIQVQVVAVPGRRQPLIAAQI